MFMLREESWRIFFFDLNDLSIFYVLLKSRNRWLKSAFIRDLGRVELWRRKVNGMRLLATILRLVPSFVSRLEFYSSLGSSQIKLIC